MGYKNKYGNTNKANQNTNHKRYGGARTNGPAPYIGQKEELIIAQWGAKLSKKQLLQLLNAVSDKTIQLHTLDKYCQDHNIKIKKDAIGLISIDMPCYKLADAMRGDYSKPIEDPEEIINELPLATLKEYDKLFPEGNTPQTPDINKKKEINAKI